MLIVLTLSDYCQNVDCSEWPLSKCWLFWLWVLVITVKMLIVLLFWVTTVKMLIVLTLSASDQSKSWLFWLCVLVITVKMLIVLSLWVLVTTVKMLIVLSLWVITVKMLIVLTLTLRWALSKYWSFCHFGRLRWLDKRDWERMNERMLIISGFISGSFYIQLSPMKYYI